MKAETDLEEFNENDDEELVDFLSSAEKKNTQATTCRFDELAGTLENKL